MINHGSTLTEIRLAHPFPWRQEHLTRGLFRMIDRDGNEVAIAALLRLNEITTAQMAQPRKEPTP